MREERFELVDDARGFAEVEPLGRHLSPPGFVGGVVYGDVVFVVVAVVELFIERPLGSPIGTIDVVMEFADVADLRKSVE